MCFVLSIFFYSSLLFNVLFSVRFIYCSLLFILLFSVRFIYCSLMFILLFSVRLMYCSLFFSIVLFKFIFCCLQDSKMVVDKYKSGFTHPTDIPFEDLSSMNFSENNTNSSTPSNTMRDRGTLKGTFSGGKSKKRGGLFGIFGSSKVSHRCYAFFLQTIQLYSSGIRLFQYNFFSFSILFRNDYFIWLLGSIFF